MGEEKPCDLRVPTVAGPVQSGGTPTCLGVTLGPTFQQELAYCVVSIAAGIVLQGTETEVGQQNQAGDRGRGGEGKAWVLEQRPGSISCVTWATGFLNHFYLTGLL